MHVCIYIYTYVYTHIYIRGKGEVSRKGMKESRSSLQIETWRRRWESIRMRWMSRLPASCTLYTWIYIHTHIRICIHVKECVNTYGLRIFIPSTHHFRTAYSVCVYTLLYMYTHTNVCVRSTRFHTKYTPLPTRRICIVFPTP